MMFNNKESFLNYFKDNKTDLVFGKSNIRRSIILEKFIPIPIKKESFCSVPGCCRWKFFSSGELDYPKWDSMLSISQVNDMIINDLYPYYYFDECINYAFANDYVLITAKAEIELFRQLSDIGPNTDLESMILNLEENIKSLKTQIVFNALSK